MITEQRAVASGEFDIYGMFGLALALSLVIASMAALTIAIALDQSSYTRTRDSVIIHRDWRANGFFYCFVCWAACAALWSLVSVVAGAWVAVIAGVAGFSISVMLVNAIVQQGRTTLEVGRTGVRLGLPHRDREFPWAAISDVRLVRVATGAGNTERPQIEFHCRASAVINHRGPHESVFSNDASVPRPYKILFRGLPVRPEALAATMEYMVAHPDERAELNSERLADMLS
ncbi:hypothetical protein [Nocardia sp. NPDC056100]|uniref:hypothetical protein n=1 Tax=Nocardia sp. NPDC056100 TaxID=3345712 RepID=UPI0035E3336C